jgi:hypothetical protein
MKTTLDAAREFLATKGYEMDSGNMINVPWVIDHLNEFAEQISEQRVKAERERLFGKLDDLFTEGNYGALVEWFESEFRKKLADNTSEIRMRQKAILDAESRIESNPEDIHYCSEQTGKINQWQREINEFAKEIGGTDGTKP